MQEPRLTCPMCQSKRLLTRESKGFSEQLAILLTRKRKHRCLLCGYEFRGFHRRKIPREDPADTERIVEPDSPRPDPKPPKSAQRKSDTKPGKLTQVIAALKGPGKAKKSSAPPKGARRGPLAQVIAALK